MRRELFTCNQFRWIDVAHPSKEELDELQREFLLHPVLVADCLDPAHLPKFERINNITFFILRVYDTDATVGSDTMVTLTRKISIFIGPQFIISIHRLDPDHFGEIVQQCFSEIKHSVAPENLEYSIPLVLVKFLNRALRSFHIPLELSEDTLERYESDLFQTDADAHMLKTIHVMRRRLSLLKRILIHSQDVVQRLSPVGSAENPMFQDLRENVASLIFITDELLEDATAFLNLQISIASQKTNEVMRVLTVFSVFFMPLTFIVGVYGMNFEFMPEIDWQYGYVFSWGLMITVTVSIGLWFRRKGWLKID